MIRASVSRVIDVVTYTTRNIKWVHSDKGIIKEPENDTVTSSRTMTFPWLRRIKRLPSLSRRAESWSFEVARKMLGGYLDVT